MKIETKTKQKQKKTRKNLVETYGNLILSKGTTTSDWKKLVTFIICNLLLKYQNVPGIKVFR